MPYSVTHLNPGSLSPSLSSLVFLRLTMAAFPFASGYQFGPPVLLITETKAKSMDFSAAV